MKTDIAPRPDQLGLGKCPDFREHNLIYENNYNQAVSAAPHSSFNPMFEEMTADRLSFASDNIVLKKILNIFKCALTVMESIIGEGDLKSDFKQFKQAVDAIFKNEIAKCQDSHDADGNMLYVHCHSCYSTLLEK